MQDESRIMLQTWLFLLLLGHISLSAAHLKRFRRQSPSENSNGTGGACQDQEIRKHSVLGGLMVKAGAITEQDLQEHNLPNLTFLTFAFQRSVLVRGWTVRGRSGSMFGPLATRRGFVTNYVVTYQADDDNGEVKVIVDPDSKEEEFVSEGNLGKPETVSDVDLSIPVQAKLLRFAPVVWSGVPFMALKLYVCANSPDLGDEVKKATDDDDEEDVAVKDVEDSLKTSRTSGTLTAALDATKVAMGLKPSEAERRHAEENPPTANYFQRKKRAHLPFTQCMQPPSWRYAAKPTPVDQFSARGNPHQAWRAILGLTYTPYLFPTGEEGGPPSPGSHPHPHHHHHHNPPHRLLEILFRNRSHVRALKVGGLGEAGEDKGRWGALTKFSLLFKDPKSHNWVYYTDAAGTPRVFTVGNRTRGSAQRVGVFHLPVPLTTDALGIFPHEWVNKPYLALDIFACYIHEGSSESEEHKTDTTLKGEKTVKTEVKKPPDKDSEKPQGKESEKPLGIDIETTQMKEIEKPLGIDIETTQMKEIEKPLGLDIETTTAKEIEKPLGIDIETTTVKETGKPLGTDIETQLKDIEKPLGIDLKTPPVKDSEKPLGIDIEATTVKDSEKPLGIDLETQLKDSEKPLGIDIEATTVKDSEEPLGIDLETPPVKDSEKTLGIDLEATTMKESEEPLGVDLETTTVKEGEEPQETEIDAKEVKEIEKSEGTEIETKEVKEIEKPLEKEFEAKDAINFTSRDTGPGDTEEEKATIPPIIVSRKKKPSKEKDDKEEEDDDNNDDDDDEDDYDDDDDKTGVKSKQAAPTTIETTLESVTTIPSSNAIAEDFSDETKELEELHTSVKQDEQQLDALDLPPDVKAKVKNQDKEIENLIAEVEKDVKNTVANTKLRPKRIKLSEPEAKKKKKKPARVGTTPHKRKKKKRKEERERKGRKKNNRKKSKRKKERRKEERKRKGRKKKNRKKSKSKKKRGKEERKRKGRKKNNRKKSKSGENQNTDSLVATALADAATVEKAMSDLDNNLDSSKNGVVSETETKLTMKEEVDEKGRKGKRRKRTRRRARKSRRRRNRKKRNKS